MKYGVNASHESLVASGYEVFVPEGSELLKDIPDESEWYRQTPDQTNAYFIYEREYPRSAPSCILMKGTYDPNPSVPGDEIPSRYYKVDLRNNAGEYFPVLRNFRYRIEIGNITHEGHSSAQMAMLGAGSSDISTSIETEDFSNISDNIARIFVSYTDTTLVSTDNFELRYKFIFFSADGDVVMNDNVEISLEDSDDGDVIKTYVRSASDNADRSGEIPLRFASSIRLTQTITRSAISIVCSTRFRFRSRHDASQTATVSCGSAFRR